MELSKVLKPVKSLMTLNHDDGLKGELSTPTKRTMSEGKILVESKDDILNALYLGCKTRITDFAFRGCTEDDPADRRLKKMMRGVIKYFSENKEELSFIADLMGIKKVVL